MVFKLNLGNRVRLFRESINGEDKYVEDWVRRYFSVYSWIEEDLVELIEEKKGKNLN